MPSTATTYNEEDSNNKGGEGTYNALLEAKKIDVNLKHQVIVNIINVRLQKIKNVNLY